MFYGLILENTNSINPIKIFKDIAKEFQKKYNLIRKQYKITAYPLDIESGDEDDGFTIYRCIFGGYSEGGESNSSIYWAREDDLITEEQVKEIYKKCNDLVKETKQIIEKTNKQYNLDISIDIENIDVATKDMLFFAINTDKPKGIVQQPIHCVEYTEVRNKLDFVKTLVEKSADERIIKDMLDHIIDILDYIIRRTD